MAIKLLPDLITVSSDGLWFIKHVPNTKLKALASFDKSVGHTKLERPTHPHMFTAAFTVAKTGERPRCPPTGVWMEEKRCVYRIEYDSAIKMKPGHLWQHRWTWRVSLWVKYVRQRKTNATWFHFYVESENMNQHNRNRLVDTENKRVAAQWEGFGGIYVTS